MSRRQAVVDAFLEASPHGVLHVVGDRIVRCNDMAGTLLGQRPRALRKADVRLVLPGMRSHGGAWLVERADADPLSAWCVSTPDGDLVFLEPSRAPTESELDQLRETDRLKTQLLNTAAHELNTPITPLRLQVHLLEEGSMGALNEAQQRAVAILSRNITRISLLVKDILDVARVNSGEIGLDMQRIALDPILDDVYESFEEAAQRVRIDLTRGPDTGLFIEGDPNRLVQVLYNLVSNALKFTPAGGRVMLHGWGDHQGVHVEVADTGAGLSKSQISKLFQPFSQAHDPKDFAATGTGLGLYISKGLVEAHGGSITCHSAGLGKGSRFTVTLPHAPESEATVVHAPPVVQEQDAMLSRLRELI